MRRIPETVSVRYTVNLLDDVRAIIETHGGTDKAYGHYSQSEKAQSRYPLPRFWRAIASLKGCHETCDSHMAWATFDSDARTMESLHREICKTVDRIARIVSRINGV